MSLVDKDLASASEQPSYEAVMTLWIALVKLANELPGGDEGRRMVALVGIMPEKRLQELLWSPATQALLDLDPPLETILAASHERLERTAAERERAEVVSLRDKDLVGATKALGLLLKRIRNKVAHGFKNRDNPRDAGILSAARHLLLALCEAGDTAIGQARAASESAKSKAKR